jgi:endoglucanase
MHFNRIVSHNASRGRLTGGRLTGPVTGLGGWARLAWLAFALMALSAAACALAENPRPAVLPMPAGPPGKPRLLRGINLGNALEAPTEGEWGVVLDASDFSRVSKEGFDHVRLPVRFAGHAKSDPPYTIDADFFRRVDWAIIQALTNGLAIVIDLHNYDALMKDPEAHRARFVALWRQIAERYSGAPQAVCFELLNEPHENLTAGRWNSIVAETFRVVRATNPTRTVVIEGIDWASAKNLRDTLSVPDDPNVVASFHMYQPILFTHQGASWMPSEFQTTGVRFPGPPEVPLTPATSVTWVRVWFDRYNREPAATNPSGLSTIVEQLAMAKAFADARHIPVYMGEFGAIDHADMASRVAWIRATRAEAERQGFGWAYWDDGGSFAAYDRKRNAWVPELKDALTK